MLDHVFGPALFILYLFFGLGKGAKLYGLAPFLIFLVVMQTAREVWRM